MAEKPEIQGKSRGAERRETGRRKGLVQLLCNFLFSQCAGDSGSMHKACIRRGKYAVIHGRGNILLRATR